MRSLFTMLLVSVLSSCTLFQDPARAEAAYMACVGSELLERITLEVEESAPAAASQADVAAAGTEDEDMLSEMLRLARARNAFDAYRDSAANHARSSADSVRYAELAQTGWQAATRGTMPDVLRAFDDRYRELYESLGGQCPEP